MPTKFVDASLSFLTSTMNASLAQAQLPASQKHTNILLLLKKPDLDSTAINNSRTVLNVQCSQTSYLFLINSVNSTPTISTLPQISLQEKALNRNGHVVSLV